MSEETNKPIEGHEYDGISELDNPLPMWWLITFFATIIFGFIYFVHYHTGTNALIEDEYAADVKKIELQRQSAPAAPQLDAKAMMAIAEKPEEIEKGKTKFQALCASCHGALGQGGIGPNLTDVFWIHGQGEVADIAKVVQEGILDKGMPAWGQVVKTDELYQLVGFVRSLKGTNPAGAKAPQGNKVQ